jgi:hypothetical protein
VGIPGEGEWREGRINCGMSSEETSVRLRRNLRLEPSEAPENVTQKHHSVRSATLPRAINTLTQLAESRGGRPLISHLFVPRPRARCLRTSRAVVGSPSSCSKYLVDVGGAPRNACKERRTWPADGRRPAAIDRSPVRSIQHVIVCSRGPSAMNLDLFAEVSFASSTPN